MSSSWNENAFLKKKKLINLRARWPRGLLFPLNFGIVSVLALYDSSW